MSKSNTGDANVDKLKDDPRRAPKVIVTKSTIHHFVDFLPHAQYLAPNTQYTRPILKKVDGFRKVGNRSVGVSYFSACCCDVATLF